MPCRVAASSVTSSGRPRSSPSVTAATSTFCSFTAFTLVMVVSELSRTTSSDNTFELADNPLAFLGMPLASYRNRLFLALAPEEEDPDKETGACERDQDRADGAGDVKAGDILNEERQSSLE